MISELSSKSIGNYRGSSREILIRREAEFRVDCCELVIVLYVYLCVCTQDICILSVNFFGGSFDIKLCTFRVQELARSSLNIFKYPEAVCSLSKAQSPKVKRPAGLLYLYVLRCIKFFRVRSRLERPSSFVVWLRNLRRGRIAYFSRCSAFLSLEPIVRWRMDRRENRAMATKADKFDSKSEELQRRMDVAASSWIANVRVK